MEYESSRILDCNGQKMRIGWDEHGWFSIEEVEPHPETGALVAREGTHPRSFPPSKAEELIEAVEEGL